MKKPVRTERVRCDNGMSAVLHYYLVRDRWFGVGVEMLRSGERTEAVLRNLGSDERTVCGFLNCLAENTVTPCTLREIWEEQFCASDMKKG